MNLALMVKWQSPSGAYWRSAFVSDDGRLTADKLLSCTPAWPGELERKVISTPHTNEYVELRPC